LPGHASSRRFFPASFRFRRLVYADLPGTIGFFFFSRCSVFFFTSTSPITGGYLDRPSYKVNQA
jgi:hypothetical protein